MKPNIRFLRIVIILILMAVILAILTSARTDQNKPQINENVKVEQVVVSEEKSVKNEFSGFQKYDVPLSEDLQLYIYELSERYGVPMNIIVSIAGQESSYNPSKMGDDGESYGLMQVQLKWHRERMEKFNVHEKDLMNPYANALIAVDYLAELLKKGDLEWALMAYNGGPDHANNMTAQGVITEYAESVIYLADNL